jgi:hypothetical protein
MNDAETKCPGARCWDCGAPATKSFPPDPVIVLLGGMLHAWATTIECWNCGSNEWELCVCESCGHPWKRDELRA